MVVLVDTKLNIDILRKIFLQFPEFYMIANLVVEVLYSHIRILWNALEVSLVEFDIHLHWVDCKFPLLS